MTYEEICEVLASKKNELALIENYFEKNVNIAARVDELDTVINSEDFWKNPDNSAISKEHRNKKDLLEKHSLITKDHVDLLEMLEIFRDDAEQLEQIGADARRFAKKVSELKMLLLLGEEKDDNNCYIDINPGAGGTESQDWASLLYRMYIRFCEKNKLKANILNLSAGEEAGIKAATLNIIGKNAYGLLKGETGIHRLVRISPFDSSKRRHTSFAGVLVTPEVQEAEIDIKDEDLRIDTYRASGSGGQHVNTTDSAVRITHLPTKTVVQCQNERSQLKNKNEAMKVLASRLAKLHDEQKQKEKDSIEKKKIEWGSQIRSYVLHPYKMVKDHRTDKSSPRPDLVLDGELNEFIEDFLINRPDKG